MEIENRSEELIEQRTNEFSERYLELLKEKKNIDEDIKTIKSEFGLDGVDVPTAVKAINKMKKDMKTSDIARNDLENMENMLAENDNVAAALEELIE